jgi:hypothetical protein
MDKKFQIFISSTYEDLKQHRDQVIKAILEMGHIPVGMEMFSAGDEQQWEIIKRQIEQSDYYIVIGAHRYGSMIGEISYTEREYDYAISMSIPTLGFLIADESEWPDEYIENNKEIQKRLANFKGKIGSKMCSMWKNEDDLYGKCSIALMKSFQAYPREGWVRGGAVDVVEMTKEVTRLSRENRELRTTIEENILSVENKEQSDIDNTINALRSNKRLFSVFEKTGTEWKRLPETNLLKLFEVSAPALVNESDENALMHVVAFEISNQQNLRDKFPIPTNFFRSWIADFTSLNLLKPSEKRHTVYDEKKYWTLTDFGRAVHANIRKNELMKGLATPADFEEETEDIPF